MDYELCQSCWLLTSLCGHGGAYRYAVLPVTFMPFYGVAYRQLDFTFERLM